MVTITDFEIQWREEFTRRLKARIEELKVSQRWVAIQSGLSQTEINKLVLGKSIPHATVLVRVARALAVDPGYLIDF